MLELSIFASLVAAYFTKNDYDNQQYGSAIFWAVLLGWDIHTVLSYI
jgi:hypothetical protein